MRNIISFFLSFKSYYLYSEYKKISACEVLLMCGDNDRGLSLNGLAYSPLMDPIYDELINKNLRCQSITLPWSKIRANRTYSGSLIINREYLIDRIKSKFMPSIKKRFYFNLLRETKAKYIIGIGLPSELCRIARCSGVETIELLHGMGYTFVPWGWPSMDRYDLPSKILALDSISEKTFKNFYPDKDSVIKIGHPFLRRFLESKPSIPEEWAYSKIKDKKNILLTISWGYNNDCDDFNGILKNGLFYEEIEQLIVKRPDIFWHIRIHPAQLRGVASKTVIPYMENFTEKHLNTTWRRASTVPLASVANVCDAHVTMSSMSCYDVAALGLRTIVLCPTTRNNGKYKDYFNDLVDEGYVVKKAMDISELESWIDTATRVVPKDLNSDGLNAWANLLNKIVQKTKGCN